MWYNEKEIVFGGGIINNEFVHTLLDWGSSVLIVMVFIALACIVTPKIARLIEKKYPKLKNYDNDRNQQEKPQADDLKSPFDGGKIEGFDPNYKIYHEDIYGVDFKHGKEK